MVYNDSILGVNKNLGESSWRIWAQNQHRPLVVRIFLFNYSKYKVTLFNFEQNVRTANSFYSFLGKHSFVKVNFKLRNKKFTSQMKKI